MVRAEPQPQNELRRFEGFVYDGPEYLTMFGGDGAELDTIDYPYPAWMTAFLWGDYAMPASSRATAWTALTPGWPIWTVSAPI